MSTQQSQRLQPQTLDTRYNAGLSMARLLIPGLEQQIAGGRAGGQTAVTIFPPLNGVPTIEFAACYAEIQRHFAPQGLTTDIGFTEDVVHFVFKPAA